MRIIISVGTASLLVVLALSQSTPTFEAADVRPSPHGVLTGMRGGYYAGGRYEVHQATMADLIRTAWFLDDNNRVIGGPAWLDDDRFDVLARAADSTTRDTAKLMLRTLLQERFSLTVHEDKMPLDAYVLTREKREPLLKPTSGQAGAADFGQCKNQPSPVPSLRTISCHGVTLQDFAKQLPALASDYFFHISMVDESVIKGAWDFTLQWTILNRLQSAGGDTHSLFEAIDQQLGLRLEMQKTPLPVVVVDHVNQKPATTPPAVLTKLPHNPTEFEVGTVKPTPPGEAPSERELPNGQIEVRGDTLLEHVRYAWGIPRGDEGSMVAGPAWMATERFDVIGKVTSENRADAPALDQEALRGMAQNLLIARFKMIVHYEDRPVTVYSLAAGSKLKLTKADPASRTSCKSTPLAAGSKSPLTRSYACQNVTMEKFAEKLRDLATDYLDHPVIDSTGLKGGWSFAFQFSPRSMAQNDTKPATELAAPDETLTLFEAVEKQLGLKIETKKAPMPVLVIDHIERTPSEN